MPSPVPERVERKRRGPSVSSQISVAAIGVVGILMLCGIAFRSTRSRGTCISQDGKVICKTKQLKEIPEDLSPMTTTLILGDKLDIQENYFYVLQQANFSSLANLEELNLMKCGIEEIQPFTFSDLKSLVKLDLSYNKLQILAQSTFHGLENLDVLILSFNPIPSLKSNLFTNMKLSNLIFSNNPALIEVSHDTFRDSKVTNLKFNKCSFSKLPDSLFQPLTSSLKNLSITNNGVPLKLHEKIFQNIDFYELDLSNNGLEDTDFANHIAVEKLSLNNNPLEELEDFYSNSNLKNLNFLSAENCKIKSLKKATIKMLNNLEVFDVSGNDLDTFDLREFDHMIKLQLLDLSKNNINNFEGNFSSPVYLPSLEELYLHENDINYISPEMGVMFGRIRLLSLHLNPLHCNCELKWLSEWLSVPEHQMIVKDYNGVMCETPEHINITQVGSHDFDCNAPVIVNATLDPDRVGLICTAEGDPAPTVTWETPRGEQMVVKPHPYRRNQKQTVNTMTLTRAGNYTCVASNVAGSDQVIINTESTSAMMGLKLHSKSQKIKILETQEGFFVTCVLITVLGLLFRYT